MWREIVVLCLAVGTALCGFPYITPTVGNVWPQPMEVKTDSTYLMVEESRFSFEVKGQTCDILNDALIRYKTIIFDRAHLMKASKSNDGAEYLDQLDIMLTKPCETYPHLNMDEKYGINVTVSSAGPEGILYSESIWGILRGLESFSQLLIPNGAEYMINSTVIVDQPRFSHRGLLVDTARHYLPLTRIFQTIDLLAMNKFNVFHWHIVDEQSFPYVSHEFPDLSAKGAYSQDRLYTALDIAAVVGYARSRGVRVVPEFDTPGHTHAWGPGQPGLLTDCYSGGKPDGTVGPVDPTNEANYDFLKTLFTEITSRFPDHYVHLGGDEVSFNCWQSNPQITDYMQKHNITGDYSKLEEIYITQLLDIISELPTKNGYVIWQEVFDNGVKIAADTVVEVWKGGWQDEMAKVTKEGYKTLLSTCWYLDYISYGADWKNYYGCEPLSFNGTAAQKALVEGGEACIWGEYVDKTNIIARTWPRASAVGEKLWSPENKTTDVNAASPRIEEFRCKLVARGYDVEALGPSFCPGDNM